MAPDSFPPKHSTPKLRINVETYPLTIIHTNPSDSRFADQFAMGLRCFLEANVRNEVLVPANVKVFFDHGQGVPL